MLHTLRSEQFWGKGLEGLFPEGSSEKTVAPWPQPAHLKHLDDYDRELVRQTLIRPPKLQEVDPRELRRMQPSVTRGGVEHYMADEYHRTGRTYEAGERRGNEYPFIYQRDPNPINPDSGIENLILAGHHRSAAALVQGKPLRAIIVRGPWGESSR